MSYSDFIKQAAQAGISKGQTASLAAVAYSGTWADLTAKPVLMQGSGPSHVGGFVPDPGSVAGTTRFLREDATWSLPTFGVQVFTAATTLTATSPRTAVFNSASAITQPLPTAGLVDGQEHRIKNIGAGTLTVTGNIDGTASSSVALAKSAYQTFIYSTSMATWVKA